MRIWVEDGRTVGREGLCSIAHGDERFRWDNDIRKFAVFVEVIDICYWK